MNVRGLIFMGTRTQASPATARFFSESLGLRRRHVEGTDAVFFDLPDGSSLAVQPSDEGEEERTVGFLVDDVRSAATELAAAAVDTDEVGEVLPYRYVHFRAPDGCLYELVERVGDSEPDTDASAAAAARTALADLAAAVAAADLDAVVAMFEPDAVLVGTAGHSKGHAAIAAYLRAIADHPHTVAWDWDDDSLVATGHGPLVSLFITGDRVWTSPDGSAERTPMRLTGVLRRGDTGSLRWLQFHGSVAESG